MHSPSAELLGHVDGGHIDGVIFDCDGVLVDSERISNGTWALLLTEIGLPMTMEQSLGIFMGNSMPRCVEIVAEMMGHAPPEDLLARFTANVTVALQRDLEPVDGIVALLDALDAAGMRYGVASNGEPERGGGQTARRAGRDRRRHDGDWLRRDRVGQPPARRWGRGHGQSLGRCRGVARRRVTSGTHNNQNRQLCDSSRCCACGDTC